ncbi:MAG TPA: CYTH domain-containing protein, partial [Longimicrobiales bacterium]|nr:CYTH domain-containing protein [Longimicrobiales bacterium]
MDRSLRFEVPDRPTLERLAGGPLPSALEETSSEVEFFRDLHFDTPAGDLKQKGSTVWLRLTRDGAATLVLDILERKGEGDVPRRRRVEARVDDQEPTTLFRGSAQPARELRALIDPDRLGKVLELETLRRVRHARAGEGEIVFRFDLVTVRSGSLAGELFEAEVEGPAEAVDRVAGELPRRDRLRPALAETVGRARELLEDLERGELERAIRSDREVAVVAHRAGAIALLGDADELRVPSAPGRGTQAARRALRRAFGQGRGRIRLLGSSAGGPGRPFLEVWLAEDIEEQSGNGAEGPPVRWVALEETLDRAGAPGLRDPRTLAALHVVARSGLASWSVAARGHTATLAGALEPLEVVLQRLEAADGTNDPSPKEVPPRLLLNMELSRLAFDERILVFAEDPDTPLLERVRFLGMFGERRDD